MDRILDDISKWSIEKRREKIEEIYKQRIGVPLNLDNPQRFTEKIQWRKLYEDNPQITRCLNKLTFKQFVREKLGDEYIVPIIDVWHSPDDVNINELPDKCVIKSNCSGDGKGTILINYKSNIDIKNIEHVIMRDWFDRRKLNTNSFFSAYYPIKPCVIVETLISELHTGVDEYKLYCFDGEPVYIFHTGNHFNNFRLGNGDYPVSFFDMSWMNVPIQIGNHINDANARRPLHFEEMKDISRKLSKDFSFVRVDFFENENDLYISELTFTHSSGLLPYRPDSFDYELGNLWKIK